MNYAFTKTKMRVSFTEMLYLIFFISLICAFRAITSMCIGTMILAGIIIHKPSLKSIFNTKAANLFAIGCILFFFLQALSLLYTNNLHEGLHDAQLKSGLIFTPLALLILHTSNNEEAGKLYFSYCLALFFASVYLLCIAFSQYLHHKTVGVFFYHALVSPFRFHAVYYSILVFMALLFLIENVTSKNYLLSKLFHLLLLAFFSFFLFLLASKLVISFYIIYCIFTLIKQSRLYKQSRLFICSSTVLLVFSTAFILLTKNPIGARFRDFSNGNISLISQDKFSPAVYFNGLQFRLLEWKLVPQILNETHAWWTGVSTGDAQALLNQKYISLNMYRGEPGKPSDGYLGYNAHNQLLQSLLQNGIPGVLSFLFICSALIMMARLAKKRILSFTVILLICYLFVESLFEEQYGIVIFAFWPLFINQYCKKNFISPKIKEAF